MANTAQILFLLLVAAAVQCHAAHRYYRGRSHGRYRNPHDYHHRRHSGENGPHDIKYARHYQDGSYSDSPQKQRVATPLNGEVNGLLPNDVGASVALNGSSLDGNVKPDIGNAASDLGLNVELGSSGDKPDDIAGLNVNGLSPNDKKPDDINDDNKAGENGAGTNNVDGMLPSGSIEQPAGDGDINVDGLSPGGDIDGSISGDLLNEPSGNIDVNGLEPGHTHGSQSVEDNSYTDQDNDASNEDKDKPDQDDNNINVDGLSPNDGDKNENGRPEDHNDYESNNGDDQINVDGLSPGGDDKISGDHSLNVHDSRPDDNDNMIVYGLSPGEVDDNYYGNNGRPSHDHVGKPNHNINWPQHNPNTVDESFIQKPNIDIGIEGGLPPGYESNEENVGLPDMKDHGGNYGELNQKPIPVPNEQPIFPGADILPYPTFIPGQIGNLPAIGIPNKVDDKEFDGKKNNSMLIPIQIPGGGQILLQASALGGIPSYIIVMINGRPTLIQNPGFAHGLSVGGAVLPQWSHLPIWLGSHVSSAGGAMLVPSSEPVQPVPVPVPVPEPVPAPQPAYNIPYPAYYWPSHWNAGTPSSPDLQKLVDLLINISSRLPKPKPPLRPIPIPAYPYPQFPYPYPPSYPYPPFVYPGKYPDLGVKPTVPGKIVPDAHINITHDRDQEPENPKLQPELHPDKVDEKPKPDIHLKPKPDVQPDPKKDEVDKFKPDIRPTPQPEVHPGNKDKVVAEPKPDISPKPIPEVHPDIIGDDGEKSKPDIHLRPKPDVHPDPKKDEVDKFKPDIRPTPQPEVHPGNKDKVVAEPKPDISPKPIPEVHPDIKNDFGDEPKPDIRPTPQPEVHPNIKDDVGKEPKPEFHPKPKLDGPPNLKPEDEEKPGTRPGFKPEYYPNPVEERPQPGHDTHIHITLPKPTHVGKPKPSQPGLDSGLVDILNILLKFPGRNSHPSKNLGPLIKLLLSILKPGDKTQTLIPSLNDEIQGQPDLGNLGSILLHVLDGRKEPNLNVLVEPGMDEATRTNIILLLNLLASNLGGSYPEMGYYQPQNPLLYFLGHFPCDHPNIPAISGMSSRSNLWQLLAKLYGHNLGRSEFRLERSAEETDEKPVEPAKDSQKN